MNKTQGFLFVFIFLLFFPSIFSMAQEYTTSKIEQINSDQSAGEGDLYIDTVKNVTYIGLNTGKLHSLSGWSLTGNPDATNDHFIGTTNDIKIQIKSNNSPMIEIGRRQTLGLTQNYPFYQDINQPLVHINGDGTTSALQFASSGAQFYKPMFFTTTNGSFRLKGSSGKTDLFEIGSAGPNNDGRLEFIIGDDGKEPMVFKRYDYRNGKFYTELFRVQGHDNSASAKVRFGININPQQIPVSNDADYNQGNSGYNVANSTLQVNGSISFDIIKTTGNISLTEDHHTIIITGNHQITLPNANTCLGRLYVLKNQTSNAVIVSNYRGNDNSVLSTINNRSTLWLQSDGSDWQKINTTSNSSTSTLVENSDGSYTFSNGFDPDVTFGASVVTPQPTSSFISNFQTSNMSYNVSTGTLTKGNQGGNGLAYSNSSQARIAANETGSIEFEMINVNNQRLSIGLDANAANPTNWNSIDYSFYIDNSNCQIISHGNNTNWFNPNFNSGDILKIEKDINNYVHFYRNNVLMHSSSVVVTTDLYFNARFQNNGTQIGNIKLIQ